MEFLNHSIYTERFNSRLPVPKWSILFLVFLLGGIVFLSIYSNMWMLWAGAFAGVMILMINISWPRTWIYTVAVIFPYFVQSSEEGFQVTDFLIGVYMQGILLAWIIWQLTVAKKKLVRNTADWFVLFFFFAYPLFIINTALAEADVMLAVRQYVIMFAILYYFPIREYFSEKKHLLILLGIFFVGIIITDLYQFYTYYQRAFLEITYAFQLGRSVRTNQNIYTAAAVYGLLFTLYIKKFKHQILMAGFTFINVAALIISYSRAYWLVFILQLLILFIYISKKNKIKLLLYIMILSLIVFLTIIIIFPDFWQILVEMIELRFLSAAQGTEDVSMNMRLYEWQGAIEQILLKPIGGSGPAVEFTFYNPHLLESFTTHYIHNGYIYYAFHVGIPMAVVFFIPQVYYTAVSFYRAWYAKDIFYKYLLVASGCALVMYLTTSFAATVYISRDGSFVLALVYAFIGISLENLDKNKTAPEGS